MYTKDKAQRITLRLNEEQFNFVKKSADMLGVSPSEFLRMVVNLTMVSDKACQEAVDNIPESDIQNFKQEALRRENEETYINN